jgi:hypothetical protein
MRTSRTRYGRRRAPQPTWTREDETSMPSPMPPAAAVALVSPTPAGSRRGCRSRRAALAALKAAPVASPWMQRATNKQAAESASKNKSVCPSVAAAYWRLTRAREYQILNIRVAVTCSALPYSPRAARIVATPAGVPRSSLNPQCVTNALVPNWKRQPPSRADRHPGCRTRFRRGTLSPLLCRRGG